MPQNDDHGAIEQQSDGDSPNRGVPPNPPRGEATKPGTDAEQTEQIKNLSRKVVWTWIVAAFGPLLALAGLVFSALQWKVADGQLSVMKAQLKDAHDGAAQARKDTDAVIAAAKSQADSMKTLADANKAMADNSAKSLTHATMQFRLSERPVLGGNGISATYGRQSVISGKRDSVLVYIRNTGRSPAINCQLSICFVFGSPPLPQGIRCPTRVASITTIGAASSQYGPITAGPFSQADQDAFRTGEKRAWVLIRGDYFDQLGERYTIDTCYTLLPNPEMWVHCDEEIQAHNNPRPAPALP